MTCKKYIPLPVQTYQSRQLSIQSNRVRLNWKRYLVPFLFWCSSLFSLTSEWTLDLNGNWSTGTPANWSAGVPNAVDDVAQFLGAITAARVVSLSQATTVGALQFNNANPYTIQSNILTLQTSTGNSQITISGGSHQISSNVVLATSLTLNNNAAGTFTLSGAVSGGGGITLSGTSGDVTFSGTTANTFTGLTTMNSPARTLNLSKTANVTSIVGDLTITAGTVHVTAAEQISNTSTVLVNGGTFQVDPVPLTFGELSFQSGTLNFMAGATITLTDNGTALSLGNGTNPTYLLAFTGTGAILLDQPSGSSANLDSNLDLGSNTRAINIPNFSVNQLDVGGILSGSGGIIKTGPGILNFDGGVVTNTFTGVTDIVEGLVILGRAAGSTSLSGDVFINGGQLNHGADEQIANTSTMIIQAGTWQLGGFTETIDRLDFIAGTFVSSPAGQLNLLSNGTALQMSGGTTLAGGNVTLSGTGQVVFDPSLGGTATIGNLDLGGNAHTFNIGNGSGDPDMTISGILSNGDLIKTGGGNLLLSGSNPNTHGTTTLNGGTLTLAKDPGVSAVSGIVTINGGTLLTQNSNQFGAGTIVTLNDGTFTIGGTTQNFGTLNYLGGTTTPFSGILELTSAANMLTMRNTQLTGNLVLQAGGGKVFFDATNNGTAVLNGTITINGITADFDIADGAATNDMVINSVISGNGLIKSGPGTLYLLGANTYSGGTTVLAGTLKGNTVSLSGNIANSGVVEFDQPFDGTFNGTLSGQGDLIKSSGGNLTFNTPQALGGTVTIQGGTFTVNSSFNNDLPGMGALTLNQGATLSGTGSIEKDIIAFGTIAPGDHSIGTLTTGGNVSMNGGSTLFIELTSSTNDLLDVGGTFTIDPNGEFFFNPLADVYVEPLTYTVVQAAGGVVGTYGVVNDPFPLIQGSLHYFANSIVLNLEFLPISNLLGLSGNAQKVAHCLDARNPPPGSDLYDVINSLRLVDNIPSIEKSLLSMQPSIFTSLAVQKQSSTLYFRDTIYDRFEIYTRSCMEEKQTFYIWATPFLSFAEENNHGKQVGYHALTSGVAMGVDGFLFKEVQVGGSLGYSHSELNWKQFRGTARIHGIYGSLYGKYQGEMGYLESAVIIGYDYYATQRNIKIRGLLPIHRSALGTHHGFESSGHLKGALRLVADHTQISPFLSFDYLYQYEGSLSEHGADSLNLKVSFKHANLFVSELGVDLAHCLDLTRKILTPHISVSGIWEKRINGGYEKSSFGGCPIDVYGYYPSRLLVGAVAGFDVKWPLKNALQASFQYKGKYGRGYQDHSFNLVLMY
jgi:autotransporter-associated beta strand protein